MITNLINLGYLQLFPLKEIFFIVGIIMPILFFLYTIGHTIFVVGEFKEKNKNIPKLLLLTISKVFIIGIIFYNVMNIIIQNDFYLKATFLIYYLLLNYGLYILIELIVINKQLNKIKVNDWQLKENDLTNDEKLKLEFNGINKNNFVLLASSVFIILVIAISTIILLFKPIGIFFTLLTISFIFYIYMKIKFVKYIKSLKR